MTTSPQGIALIKQLEGLRLQAYPDGNGYSVGYGHHGVPAGTVITEQQAHQLLLQDLPPRERAVNNLHAQLTQNQFDALVSLAYNIGTTALARSTLAALVRTDPTPRPQLQQAWHSWHLASGTPSTALQRRRQTEYQHYSTPDTDTTTTASTPHTLIAALAVAALLLAIL